MDKPTSENGAQPTSGPKLGSIERSWMLVGRFVHQWSDMEHWLGHYIHRLLGLDFARGAVVTNNIYFDAKLNIFKTALDDAANGKMSEQWRDEASKKLDGLRKLARHRNVIAHNTFDQSESEGVDFFLIKSKGSFEQFVETWSENDFAVKGAAIEGYSEMMMQLMSELHHDGLTVLQPRRPTGLLDPLTPLYPG